MNKKSIISLSLFAAFVLSTAVSVAETTIYTDGIGRMHFLGKDPGSNTVKQNYSNSAEQDLTRKLYENSAGEVNNVDYKLKNYDDTFGFGRKDTQTIWKNKFANQVDAEANEEYVQEGIRGSMTFTKGASERNNASTYGISEKYGASQAVNKADSEINVIQDSATAKKKKKHWWSK